MVSINVSQSNLMAWYAEQMPPNEDIFKCYTIKAKNHLVDITKKWL